MKSYSYDPAGTIEITTTGNITALDPQGCGLVRMNNASLSTIQGIKAGFPGQRLTIRSVGAGQVDCAHQNGSAAAGTRLVNSATSAPTSLAAGSGSIVYQYDETQARWALINHNQGAWISVPFNAANFVTDGTGVWTVVLANQITFAYVLDGTTMTVSVSIINSTLTSTPVYITVPVPGGFSSAFSGRQVTVVANTTNTNGMVIVSTSGVVLFLYRDASGTAYAAQTNAFNIFATLTFQVQ